MNICRERRITTNRYKEERINGDIMGQRSQIYIRYDVNYVVGEKNKESTDMQLQRHDREIFWMELWRTDD